MNRDIAPAADAVTSVLINAYAQGDELRRDLDRLAIHVEALLRERAHIIAVLTDFYRSELSLSSVSPVLDLARHLHPALDERLVR